MWHVWTVVDGDESTSQEHVGLTLVTKAYPGVIWFLSCSVWKSFGCRIHNLRDSFSIVNGTQCQTSLLFLAQSSLSIFAHFGFSHAVRCKQPVTKWNRGEALRAGFGRGSMSSAMFVLSKDFPITAQWKLETKCANG